MSHRLHDPEFLAARYRLNGHARDSSGHNRHGALINAPTWDVFNKGLKTCIRTNGTDQYTNIGDRTELHSVSAFTLTLWMNQDVIDVSDSLFAKIVDANNQIRSYTFGVDGNLYVHVSNGSDASGMFDYSAVISASSWHHIAVVFDGTGAANIDRLVVYVDGNPMVLAFAGTIPATTADMTGYDMGIGGSPNSFDGMMYDFRSYLCALSRDEVYGVIHDPIGSL